MYPAIPALLGSLRLATIRDVPRIAVVATAGFYYSTVFPWERRYHHQYPDDTFKSYEKMFARIIRDPEYVALVVEDSYQPTENSLIGANIITDPDHPVPQPTRKGQFVDHADLTSPNKLFYDGGLGRDKDKFHADSLDEKCNAAQQSYFADHALKDMAVVHPAYWRRGHGSALTKWGVALADIDGVKQGVIAAEMGEKLYLSMGFEKLGIVHVQDDEQPPNKIEVGLLRYDPGQCGFQKHLLKSDF